MPALASRRVPTCNRHVKSMNEGAAATQPPVEVHTAPAGLCVSRRALFHWTALLPLVAALSAAPPAPALAQAQPAPGILLPDDAKQALETALEKVAAKTKAPVLLRLVFHDAGTYDAAAGDGGANASIRLELDRPENKGLKRGWNVIEALRKELQGTAADGLVSGADLIAVAGAHVVLKCGGPAIQVPVGRLDSEAADPPGRVPGEMLSAAQLRAEFAAKGLTTQELVVLSGSHTLGSKGYGDPLTFDNTYFKELLNKPWNDKSNQMADMIGIPSDHVIADDSECLPFIRRYADDQAAFFADFAAAYVKLAGLGATWRQQ